MVNLHLISFLSCGLFITNLKPRKMAGTESQGMMLVAEDEHGKVQLVQFPDVVKNGVRLR